MVAIAWFKRLPRCAAVLALLLAWPWPAQADTLSVTQLHVLMAIHDAGLRWRVSVAYLDCLAGHESGFVPWAVGQQGEEGVFQFQPATFYAWSPNSLDAGKGLWNAWSNADVAAYAISRGQSHAWTTTAYCGYWYTAYGY